MGDILKPDTADQVVEAVRWAAAEEVPLEVVAGASKRGLGRPVQAEHTLDLSGLSGITLYEPEELVLSARAGTKLSEIEAALAEKDQMLAFEPADLSPLLGSAPGSASIGGALYPINADNSEMLFRAASNALAKAKMQGRNALAVFDTEMKQRMQRHEALERDLRSAIERNEFVVYYQPQIELASGRLRGYEALVRWERPGEGILSPRDFLSVAEETGLILPIGNWVLRKACQDAAEWLEADSVAVNLSSAQFRSQEIDKTIAGVLQDTGLAPDRLEIEVPENLFLDGAQDVMDTLNCIKALGVRIAMDDFGCGYAGLASLAQFPFDKIKIDRSFVGQLTEDADVAAIVTSIVSLGRSISVDVTAEGVETKEQVTLLRAAGCSIVQGFRFGAPQRGAAVAANAARMEAENLHAADTQDPVERAG